MKIIGKIFKLLVLFVKKSMKIFENLVERKEIFDIIEYTTVFITITKIY